MSSNNTHQWACTQCTFWNDPNRVKCVMCETSRDNTEQPLLNIDQSSSTISNPELISTLFRNGLSNQNDFNNNHNHNHNVNLASSPPEQDDDDDFVMDVIQNFNIIDTNNTNNTTNTSSKYNERNQSQRKQSQRNKSKNKTVNKGDTLPEFNGLLGPRYNQALEYAKLDFDFKEYDQEMEKDPSTNPFAIRNSYIIDILRDFFDQKMDLTTDSADTIRMSEGMLMLLGFFNFYNRTICHGLRNEKKPKWESQLPTHGKHWHKDDSYVLKKVWMDTGKMCIGYELSMRAQHVILIKEATRYRKGLTTDPPRIRTLGAIASKYKQNITDINDIVTIMISGDKEQLIEYRKSLLIGVCEGGVVKGDMSDIDDNDLISWGVDNEAHRTLILNTLSNYNLNENEE